MAEAIGGLFVDLAANVEQFRADMKAARGALSGMATGMAQAGKKISAVGREITTKISAPLGVFGALSMKTAIDFDDSMRKVAAKSEASGEQLERMTALAKEMGRTTKFTASQSAEAMTFLAQAGLKVDEVMTALPGTMALAATEGMDLGAAADIVSNVMSGMGKEASDLSGIVDILADASRSGNTNVSMLGSSFAKVGPILRANGQSIETAAAAFDILGNAGIQAEEAGTGMKSAMAAMLKGPSKGVAETMKKYGLSFVNAEGQIRDFAEIIRQLEPVVKDQQTMFDLFGNRGAVVMTALAAEGADKLGSLRTQFEGSAGAAKEMSDVMEGGVGGSVRKAASAFEGLQIAITESGLLDTLGEMAEKFAALTSNLVKNYPEVTAYAGAVVAVGAALGPVVYAVGVLATLLSPLTPVLVAVGGAFFLLYQQIGKPFRLFSESKAKLAREWPEFVGYMRSMVDGIKAQLTGRLGGIMTGAIEKVGAVKDAFYDMWNKVTKNSYVPDMLDDIRDEFGRLATDMVKPAEQGTSKVSSLFDGMREKVGGALASLGSSFLNTAIGSVFDSVGGGKASPTEQVDIRSPGTQRGMGSQTITQNFGAGVTRAELSTMMPKWKAETVAAVAGEKSRGGSFGRRMQAI